MSRYNISNVRAAFVDVKTGALTKFGIDVLQKISLVLGLPGGDVIADTTAIDTYDSTAYASSISYALKRIKELESLLEYSSSVYPLQIINKTISNETYTAVDNMFVNMTNRSTLILPLKPKKNSIVYFSKDATKAILQGNGRKVNGSVKDIVFYKERLARQIHYFIDVDEWFFI
jgi:hypothetical protein